MASTLLVWCIIGVAGVTIYRLLTSSRGSVSIPGINASWSK